MLLAMGSVTRKSRAVATAVRRPAIEAKLLDATKALLADGTSYTELSIQQLCSQAGIARSTFYVYFRDKADLVGRLAEEVVGQLAAAASAWWQPQASRAELLAATRRVIEVYTGHAALFAALTETAAYDAEMRAMQVEIVERNARPLAELITAGKRDGSVRDVHTPETVSALAWMLQGSCYNLPLDAGEEQINGLAEALTAIIWHSIYPDSRSED